MRDLGDLLTLEYGDGLPAQARTGSGFPVYGSNGVVGFHDTPLVDGPGIIVGRKGSVGKAVWSDRDFWPIDTTYYVKSAGDQLSWLYRILSWLPLETLDSSTGVPGLNRNDVYRIRVFRPDPQEQIKIAQILDSLDTQIRQTEALIAKLERIKQGLLTDLLTRGIDENGQLRPTSDQAPQLYKDSPLGRIPKEWDAVPLDQLAENLDGKRVPIKKAVRKSGIYPYYGASGVIDWVDGYIFDGDYILLGEDGENVVSRKLPLAFRATGRIWVNNHAHIYQPRPCTDIRFLLMVMEEKDYSKWVLGSAQPKLTQKAISFIRFVKPSFQEQALIADMVEALDERIDAEMKVLRKLGIKKLGIMDDLLTGRVRVTPLLAANQQAIA